MPLDVYLPDTLEFIRVSCILHTTEAYSYISEAYELKRRKGIPIVKGVSTFAPENNHDKLQFLPSFAFEGVWFLSPFFPQQGKRRDFAPKTCGVSCIHALYI